MSNISQWDPAAANNQATPPDGAPETTMLVPQLNDTMREMMAATARWYAELKGATATGGTGNSFTLTSGSSHASYADMGLFAFRANRTNGSGASTLNVDGLGAKSLKINGDDPPAGSLREDGVYLAAHNSEADVIEIFGPAIPADGSVTTAKLADGAVTEAKVTSVPLPRGYLSGLETSNSAPDTEHDTLIAEGAARDEANSENLVLAAPLTKRIDATWAAGSGNGGLANNGGLVSLQANTWYHLFLVKTGAGAIDAGWDTSLTAANLLVDCGGTKFKRIWSHWTDGSANIRQYLQHGDECWWKPAQPLEINTSSSSDDVVTVTLDAVPPGFRTRLLANFYTQASSIILYGADLGDFTPSRTATPLGSGYADSAYGGGQIWLLANESQQIKYHSEQNNHLRLAPLMYIDTRGR